MSAASIGSASATASRPSCSCRPGRSCTRTSGRCRCPTSRATSGWSPSTRAATAAPSAPPGRPPTRRPSTPRTCSPSWTPADTERAVVVSLSMGAQRSLLFADEHPERVLGLAFVAPSVRLVPDHPMRGHYARRFLEQLETDEGWAKFNASYLAARLPRLPPVLLRDGVQRAALDQADRGRGRVGPRDRSRDADRDRAGEGLDEETTRAIASRVRCPVMVIHGEEDGIRPVAAGEELAAADRRRVHADAGRRALPAGAQARRREPGPT